MFVKLVNPCTGKFLTSLFFSSNHKLEVVVFFLTYYELKGNILICLYMFFFPSQMPFKGKTAFQDDKGKQMTFLGFTKFIQSKHLYIFLEF